MRLAQASRHVEFSVELIGWKVVSSLVVEAKLFRWSPWREQHLYRAVVLDEVDSELAWTFIDGFCVWHDGILPKMQVWWRFKKKPYRIRFKP